MKILYSSLIIALIPLFSCQISQNGINDNKNGSIQEDKDKVQTNDNEDKDKSQSNGDKNNEDKDKTQNNDDKVVSNSKVKYDLPLEYNVFHECENKIEKVYTIDKDLNFSYYENDKEIKFKISENDKKGLLDLLSKNDIYELDKKSEKIPDDAPQTEECRAISQLNLMIDGKGKIYGLNDREYYHTDEYKNAFNNIKNKLDEIKKNNQSQVEVMSYSLPLIYREELEFNGKIHELKIDKDNNLEIFYLGEENKKFKLDKNDIDNILKKAQELKLDELFEKSEKVSDDAPQTKEIRTIMSLTLNFKNKEKIYDRNSRKYRHTEEYLKAFDSVLDELKTLVSKYFSKVEISINQEVSINKDYKLKLVKVEDSRCPENVQCIWAGKVVSSFQLIKNDSVEKEFDLDLSANNIFENTLFKINLLEVSKSGHSVLDVFIK